jgi:hypothetical protein
MTINSHTNEMLSATRDSAIQCVVESGSDCSVGDTAREVLHHWEWPDSKDTRDALRVLTRLAGIA